MASSPCKDCPDRRVEDGYNCHTDCPRYAAMREELAREKAARLHEREYSDYTREKLTRRRRWRMAHEPHGGR